MGGKNPPCKVELGAASQCFASVVAFFLQLHNLSIERPYGVMRFFDRSHQIAPFALPSLHSIELSASPTKFGFDFLAKAALCCCVFCQVDEFHPACFAGTVFIVALMGEVGPSPVPTRKSPLVVKTHAYQISHWCSLQGTCQTYSLLVQCSCFRVCLYDVGLA